MRSPRGNGKYKISSLQAPLMRHRITRRKLQVIARARSGYDRAAFLSALRGTDPARYLFIDESRKDPPTLYRRYGRGRRGGRTFVRHHFTRATRGYSVCAGMTLHGGIVACDITNVDGVDRELFIALFRSTFLPLIQQGTIVIMDNAIIHYAPEIEEMIKEKNAELLFLPAYSFDLNPIEQSFSKMKSYLVRNRAEAVANPKLAMMNALMSISVKDTAGYFRQAG